MKKIKSFSSGPMADIAFLLLIFFLITTQFPKEEGVKATLPPIAISYTPKPTENVDILLNGQDQIMVNGTLSSKSECARMVYSTLRSNPSKYRVTLKSHEAASYDAYVNVYQAVKSAYQRIHEQEAMTLYGKRFQALIPSEQNHILQQIPIRIQEYDLVK